MRLLLSTFAFLIITNLGFSYRFSGQSFYKRSLSEKLLLAKVSGKNNNEVRVRLLKDSTEGLGQKGDIVMISSSLWMNVYQPKKLAEKISDEELIRINQQLKQKEEDELSNALEVQKKLEAIDLYKISRKIGANGQLFGSINAKTILELIKSQLPTDILNQKYFSVLEFKCDDESSASSVLEDIRKAGTYTALINLHPKVKAKFKFSVVSESSSSADSSEAGASADNKKKKK